MGSKRVLLIEAVVLFAGKHLPPYISAVRVSLL
jgi:hypothetical protein